MYPTVPGWRQFAAVALLIAVIHPVLYGDDQYFEARDISALTVPSVRDICEDNYGYIWAATPGGVIRYDGRTPVLWDRKKIPKLPSENIISIEFDETGSELWIGTDAGLVRYNIVTEEAESVRYVHVARQNVSLQVIDIEISDIHGVFSVTEDGVYILGPEGTMVESLIESDADQYAAPVIDLTVDRAGTVWAVTTEGLKKWDATTTRFIAVLDIPRAREIESVGSELWIGTDRSTVYRFRPDSRELSSFPVPGPVNDFAIDTSGRLWMASLSAGLSILSPETGDILRCPIDTEHPYRLSSSRIDCVYSNDSLVWIGSIDSGLYSVDIRQSNHLSYTRRSGANSLPNGPIRVISEDSLGYLWTASDIGGLARIDPYSDDVRQYVADDDDSFSISSDNVTSVIEDSTGRIWVGTDHGPALYISEIEGFEPPGDLFGGWPDLRGKHVVALAESGDGSIWMSLRSGELYKLNALERDFKSFSFSPASVPQVLYTDRFGSLWAGSRSNLWLFGDNGRLVKTWNLSTDIPASQLSAGISSIFADSQDRHWFGGPAGLTVYPGEEWGFLPVGLPGGEDIGVTGITEDPDGNLWIANGRSIHVFDRDIIYLRTIGAESGFTPAGFISSITRGRNGDILVGANGQVWSFPGLPEEVPGIMPNVHLISVRVADRDRIGGPEALAGGILEIRPEDNTLRIEFGAVDFGSGENIRYEHWLDGVEDWWTDSDESHRIYYANLPHREMTFSARPYNTETGIKGEEVVLYIRVVKPGWQRWWALILYAAVLGGLVTIFIKLREGELLKGQVQDLEEARSEALKANEKLEFLTMNDALSGLLNRRGFDRAIHHALSTASRNGLMISLFMMDVDFFKLYNDNYGHVKGDEVLRGVGRALRSVFGRSTDIIARYGGEEFSVVFIGENPNAMVTLANDLLMAIHELSIVHEYSEASDRLTLSIGLATIRATSELTAGDLVDLSDQALYAAKDGGRKRVCFTGILPEMPEKMKNGTAPMVLGAETDT